MFIHSTWWYAARTSTEHNTFSGKREPSDFPSFCSDFIPIFQRFSMIFTQFSTHLTHVSGFFWERGQNGTNLYRFFCVKSTHLNVTSPCILHNKFLPLGTCRGTQIFLISSIYGMHRSLWEFRNLIMKKVLETGTFLKRHMWSSPPPRHKL